MYKFEPILKTLVWGTESWVLSGVPGDESVVSEGPDAGKKITDIYPGQFPLLIKFIDAHDDLSIQVHPDDEVAAARHGCKGKTEMWYIIGTRPGAHLLSGMKQQLDPERYVEYVNNGHIADALARYDVKEGDVFFLPAGRVHAIGGGCYLAEIQETSDITYRIYDYNRLGLDGKPRELHTEQAKDVIDYSVLPDYRTFYEHQNDSEVNLVKCRHFTTGLLELTRPYQRPLDDCGSFLILISLEGNCTIQTGSESLTLSPGQTVLVPVSAGADGEAGSVTIIPTEGAAKLLTTHI